LVIPGGVSCRSTGAGDSLRMFLNLHEPIFKVFKEADHTSETTYVVKRHNGPAWVAPPAAQGNSKVVEKLYIWDEDPDDATMKDPEFLAEVEKTKLTVSPMTGEDMQKLVAQVSNLPPNLIDKVRAAYVTGAN